MYKNELHQRSYGTVLGRGRHEGEDTYFYPYMHKMNRVETKGEIENEE
jgi:hypothetical protein